MKIRYERKILLTDYEFSDLRRFFSFILDRDTHTPEHKESYQVNSVYFDSPNDQFFHEKIEGDFEHNKIRLRSYGFFPNESDIYWEHKYKKGPAMIKVREWAGAKTEDIFSTGPNIKNITSKKYFDYFFQQYNLRPTLAVFYEREAFEGALENQKVRVNFDFNMRYALPATFYDLEQNIAENFMHDRHIVLEIKTEEESLPKILLEKLNYFGSSWEAFSKYANGRIAIESRNWS